MQRDSDVLRNKRDASAYQILVEIADRQPAVSQREIAEAVGVTAQAVSDYVGDLVDDGYVHKRGRGRYEVTKEGVDWLIAATTRLGDFVEYVEGEVIEQVDVDAAIAVAPVEEGDRVTLSMRDGVLHADPETTGGATAVAVTGAAGGGDVGVTDFSGVLDYELGAVTVVPVPDVEAGGSDGAADIDASGDLLAAAGTEALAAVRAAGREPDVRFGTVDAVEEAATKGLDVLLVAAASQVSAHTDRLRSAGVTYEVVEG